MLRRIIASSSLALNAALAVLALAVASPGDKAAAWREPPIPCASDRTVTLGRDLDGDGDADEVDIHLEVDEIQEEVYPGRVETFWVFAPEGQGMCSPARLPSPTIRLEVGDHVRIHLHNTHYLPHTIHLHGTIHANAMDGVPEFTQKAVMPGDTFTYEFVAKQPGTFWYHCHVQPDVHVLMGLAGMLIVEPNRARNHFRHLVLGAGRIEDLARAEVERGFTSEYSLVYMDMDDRLNHIPAATKDPRQIEARMHREYDSTQRQPDLFLLNGRSFPFTLRDTPIRVRSNERVRLRILNAGARTLSLHLHGHHPRLIALDGYDVSPAMQYARDVFTIGPAQRVDLELRTGSDGYAASGPGVWLVHDHTEQATTNAGINPGGDLTAIVYDGFVQPDGLPRMATNLKRFFDADYYRGKIPVFDPSIFHTTREYYSDGWIADDARTTGMPYPTRSIPPSGDTTGHAALDHEMEEHRVLANACPHPRGFQRIVMKEGARYGREGEVYGFEPRVIHAERCEEVEIVLENTDSVRHALMIPNLDPMFMMDFAGPGTRSARFITPDRDITLSFHCHVALHEKMGMVGELVVGKGGTASDRPDRTQHLWHGIGTVVSVDLRKSRVIIDHEEIPGFMAAMTMNYAVTRPELLTRVKTGDRIRFTIDAEQRGIVDIQPR